MKKHFWDSWDRLATYYGVSLGPGSTHGVAKSQTWLSDFTFTFHFHSLEKEMATHFSVLAWRIPRTVEPDGLPSVGSHRVGHDWGDLAAAAAAVLQSLGKAWESSKTPEFISCGACEMTVWGRQSSSDGVLDTCDTKRLRNTECFLCSQEQWRNDSEN